MPRIWFWLLAALLVAPMATAHHKEGHDRGLIHISLGEDHDEPDDRDGEGGDERDDRDDERGDDDEERDSRAATWRSTGVERGPDENGCIAISANATKSGNAVAWNSDGPASIYRASGEGEFQRIHEAGPDEVLLMDRDLKKGVSYRYMATTGELECPVVEVTAVPFMPGWAGVGLAAMSGFALWHHRKQGRP